MRAVGAAALLVFAGCARVTPPQPPPPPGGPVYIDLEAGWRVRVITPKLKSGGFLLKDSGRTEAGGTITLRAAGDEFQGFETATYSVAARKDGGVRVTLSGVEFNREGATAPAARSFAPRFRMPGRHGRVRLLYMQKVSDADHAMAVLAATDLARLRTFTGQVLAAPETACRVSRHEYCEWIPAGVALRPERREGVNWTPARF